ncbi:MAG: putative sulfate exporter family transporter [Bifidobacterium sp.]|nr:putative sulfate exporter family transporter [Bifidobacterium sp.]
MKWGKRIATKEMLLIAIVTLAATGIGMWAAQFEGLKILGALIIALLIGMVVQFPIRAWYVKGDAQRQAGVKDAAGLIANKFLRFGIILLGFKLNLQMLFTTGAKCLPLAALVVTVTIFVTYGICRLMGVDPLMAILVSCGTGICGAAAVMGVSGSIKVTSKRESEKENDEVTAIAIVAIMGTIFALIEIAVLPLLGLSQQQEGFIAGGSLHEIAHAVAAGEGLNRPVPAGVVDAATMANIMKLSRVLMLVFVSIIVAIWWDKRHSEATEVGGKRKIAFPWFMLGFIATAAIGTLLLTAIPSSAGFVNALGNDVAKIFLGMAMAALGINVNFKAIAKNGVKPLLASFIASIILVVLCYGLALLFF